MRASRVFVGATLVASLAGGGVGIGIGAAVSGASSNLACASAVVATWPLAQIANETIVVPVDATNIGGMGPAAREGFGGLLLFGTTAPAALPGILATLQRERPAVVAGTHYQMLVMTDEEGGGVESGVLGCTMLLAAMFFLTAFL